MFNIIKSNISETDARELYPDKYMILMVEDCDMDELTGDLIFVGTEKGRREFYEKHEPPTGYLFLILKGHTLELRDLGSVQLVTPLRLEAV